LAVAVVGLVGCQQAGGEHPLNHAAGGNDALGSSPSGAPPPPSATAHEEHDCRSHSPQRHGPAAPSATKLSARDRAKVTSVQVLAHGSAIIVRKQGEGWVMGGPSGCVQRALDNLSSLKVVANGAPPSQDDRQIILLDDDSDVLLQYDVGVGAGGADPARLPDGSVVQLRGLHRGLLSSQPDDWCLPKR
jgi:hypothetical protein